MKGMHITVIVLSVISFITPAIASDKEFVIGVLNWTGAQDNLDAVEGFKKVFELSQVPHRFDVVEVAADGAKAKVAVQKWKDMKANLICAVGGEAANLVVSEVKDVPIVFLAVSNPVLSGLVDSWDRPGRNATGSSDWIDVREKLGVFKDCLPQLKTLGVIYEPNDPISSGEVFQARTLCKSMDISLREATVKSADEISPAIERLTADKIDALWIPVDSLVCNNMSKIAGVAHSKKLPVVSSSIEGLNIDDEDPIVMTTVKADYGQLGRLGAEAAIGILTANKVPGDIPVRTLSNYSIIIYANAAASIGYAIPPTFLAKAQKILKGYEGQSITITGTGDSEELIRALGKALRGKLNSGRIDIPSSVGSSGGIKALQAGKANLARVARNLKKAEAEAGLTCKTFAVAPVVFVVHPSVTGIDDISSADIVGIYTGKITKWEMIGGAEGRIYAVIREPGDSCLQVLIERISGFKDITEPKAKVTISSSEARETLVSHVNTFGFLAATVAVGTDLRILKVDGVSPSAENVRSGKYKLVVPLGVVYKGELTGLCRRFVDFLFSDEAKDIILRLGAIPVDKADK